MVDLSKVVPQIKVETAPDHKVQGWYRLRLKRFRRYEEFELPIPASGIVLLDGRKGIGKSTIFQAISFVMYDNAGNTCYPRKDRNSKKKLDSTAVELTFPDPAGLVIYRQRRPNLLRVRSQQIDLVDDVAQAYINQTFGSYASWLAGGYLEQDQICSFFSMSGVEKLQFLQELSAADRQGFTSPEQLELILNKVAQRYNGLSQQLTQVEFQMKLDYEMYMRLHQQMPPDYRQFGLWSDEMLQQKFSQLAGAGVPCTTLAELSLESKRWGQKRNQELQTRISESTTQLTKAKEQQGQRERLERTRVQIKSQLESLLSTSELPRMERELSEVQEQMKCERRTQLLAVKGELQRKFELISDNASSYTLSELDTFEKILAKPPIEELTKGLERLEKARLYYLRFEMYQWRESKRRMVQEMRDRLTMFPEKSRRAEIDDLSKQIWLIGLQDRRLVCPKCQASLHLNNGALAELHECLSSAKLGELIAQKDRFQGEEERYRQKDQLAQQVELQQASLQQLEKICERDLEGFDPNNKPELVASVPQIDFLIGQMRDLIKERERVPNISVQEERTKIYQGQERARIIREIQGVELELKGLPEGGLTPVEVGLQGRKEKLEAQIRELKKVEVTRIGLTGNLTQVQTQLDALIPVSPPTETPEQLRAELDRVTAEFQRLEQEVSAQIYFTEMIGLQKKYEGGQKSHQEILLKLGSLQKIKQCLVTAEYIILDNILSEINSTIAEVLEQIFIEPISVTLRSMRQLRSDDRIKPEINCEIIYDGIECGSIKEMSGGEKSQICLAMVIAFSSFSHIPFVFLDEALSSLDVVSKESTISTIRKYLKDKLVITVNHDTTKGVYDSVLSLQ